MPATNQSAVSTLIREVLADPDLAHDEVFRRLLQAGLQDLVDAEAAAVIGAQRYERTPQRTNRRNGTRPKTVATTAGEVELAIPELRTGSFFPSLLHPRRRVDKARMRRDLLRPESRGSPPARPGDLVRALGNESGISRSTVSRICKDIDEGVHEFLSRRLDRTWFPYLFVDATYLDVRVGHRVVCRALVVATGVSAEGRREIPEHGPGGRRDGRLPGRPCPAVPARTGAQGPLPGGSHRGRAGRPVTRTPASGPRSGRSFPGRPGSAAAPRFARNITSRLGSARSKPVNALVSTIFAQTSQEAVAAQYKHVIDSLREAFPEIAQMLIDAQPDPTAFATTRPPRGALDQDLVQQPHRAAQPGDQAPRRRRPGLPRQRLRTPPDRLRPVRATRSGSTANAATCPRPPCSA